MYVCTTPREVDVQVFQSKECGTFEISLKVLEGGDDATAESDDYIAVASSASDANMQSYLSSQYVINRCSLYRSLNFGAPKWPKLPVSMSEYSVVLFYFCDWCVDTSTSFVAPMCGDVCVLNGEDSISEKLWSLGVKCPDSVLKLAKQSEFEKSALEEYDKKNVRLCPPAVLRNGDMATVMMAVHTSSSSTCVRHALSESGTILDDGVMFLFSFNNRVAPKHCHVMLTHAFMDAIYMGCFSCNGANSLDICPAVMRSLIQSHETVGGWSEDDHRL
jgi:hypothetical protein